MVGYRQRLESDLTRWQQAGWVDPQHRDAILADAAAHSRGFSAAPVLAMLGAVLLCFGVMLFVGAQWQEMPRLARLGVLFAGIWASYGIAGLLRARGAPLFAEAAIVVAIGIYGAAIMLIGQLQSLCQSECRAAAVAGRCVRGSLAAALQCRLCRRDPGCRRVDRGRDGGHG
jgi:uncharacterized membrane protein